MCSSALQSSSVKQLGTVGSSAVSQKNFLYIVAFFTLTAFQTCKINGSTRDFFSIGLPRLLRQGRGVADNIWSFSELWTGIYTVSVGCSIGDWKQSIILFALFY